MILTVSVQIRRYFFSLLLLVLVFRSRKLKVWPHLSLRKSTTLLKSLMQYSLFMSISTLSEADCTGT